MRSYELQLEAQLIEKIKEGRRSAFDLLIERYKERAFALAYNITGNHEDAKDVLQEAFVKAYLNIKGFKASSSFYTWFYRILVNLCRDYLRRKRIQGRILTQPLELEDEEGFRRTVDIVDNKPNPAEAALNKETMSMVEQALDFLPQKQRVAFILKYIQGVKSNEIAEMLNCRESTVKVHLFRALQKLQKRLLPYLFATRQSERG